MKRKIIIFCKLLFVFCLLFKEANAALVQEVNNKELKNRIDSFKGTILIVNFFVTWIPVCEQEIAGLVKMYERYKDNNIQIIGVCFEDTSLGTIKPLADKLKISYPVFLAEEYISGEYNIKAFPTTHIIDERGDVLKKQVGYRSEDFWEEEIGNLIREREQS